MSPRYREHRIRTSLERVNGRTHDSDHVRDMAAAVYREGRGVYFSEEQLEGMPWQSRELIKAEAKRLYGNKWGG